MDIHKHQRSQTKLSISCDKIKYVYITSASGIRRAGFRRKEALTYLALSLVAFILTFHQ